MRQANLNQGRKSDALEKSDYRKCSDEALTWTAEEYTGGRLHYVAAHRSGYSQVDT